MAASLLKCHPFRYIFDMESQFIVLVPTAHHITHDWYATVVVIRVFGEFSIPCFHTNRIFYYRGEWDFDVDEFTFWIGMHHLLILHFKLCMSSRERRLDFAYPFPLGSPTFLVIPTMIYLSTNQRERFHAEIWVEYQAKCNANNTWRTKLPKSCQNTFSFEAYHRVNRCACKKEM